MELKQVDSSNLEAVGWENNRLRVQFKTGAIYEYDDVPETVFKGIINTGLLGGSVGKFFHKNIKNSYKYHQVTSEELIKELQGNALQQEFGDNILSGKGVITTLKETK